MSGLDIGGGESLTFTIRATLDPSVTVIAPWRMEKFRNVFPGRTELIAYCEQKNIRYVLPKIEMSCGSTSLENCICPRVVTNFCSQKIIELKNEFYAEELLLQLM